MDPEQDGKEYGYYISQQLPSISTTKAVSKAGSDINEICVVHTQPAVD